MSVQDPSFFLVDNDENIILRLEKLQYLEELANGKVKFYYEGRAVTLDIQYSKILEQIRTRTRYPNNRNVIDLTPNP